MNSKVYFHSISTSPKYMISLTKKFRKKRKKAHIKVTVLAQHETNNCWN